MDLSDNKSTLIQVRLTALGHYLSQCWPRSMSPIGVTRPCVLTHTFLANIDHDDVIKWKHFPRYWPFVGGIHMSPVNSPHNGQWCAALMFSLIWAWINGWVNNCKAGDLRRRRAHYDVTVMLPMKLMIFNTFNKVTHPIYTILISSYIYFYFIIFFTLITCESSSKLTHCGLVTPHGGYEFG